MKTKKRNINEAFFIVTLVLVVILLLILIIKQLNNESEFKITKEECYNETFNVSLSDELRDVLFTEFNVFNSYIEKIGCYGEFDERCDVLINAQNQIVKKIQSNEIFEEKEVCEQVEVDEIVLNKILFFEEINWSWDKSEFIYIEYKSCDKINDFKYECKLFSDTSENFSVIVEAKNIDTSLSKTIPKEDLTIDWLDENCEVKQFDRELSEDELKDVRGIYQCQEYEVRILK